MARRRGAGSANEACNGSGGTDTGANNEARKPFVAVMVRANDKDSKEPTDDARCGLGSYRPAWMQALANKKIFLAVFCLTSVLQGMYYTYFVSVLTTIEKLFQIQSKTTGIIMSATEMGQIGGALLLTYYGGHGHRPKWIACGMLVFALASFFCSMPHFLFGTQLSHSFHTADHHNQKTRNPFLCPASSNPTWASVSPFIENFTEHGNLTQPPGPLPLLSHFADNFTELPSWSDGASSSDGLAPVYMQDLEGSEDDKMCGSEGYVKHAKITQIVLAIFFVSLLFIGIGATAVYTLGIPYIDDNVANRDSPLYFGITIGVRILGPVCGFLLGSFCTSLYVNPFEDPIFDNTDSRWIGAWWLGLFIVAVALVLASFAMLSFPRQLPAHKAKMMLAQSEDPSGRAVATTAQKPSLKDFPVAMRRLLKNDVLLCRTASSVLHILPIAGLYTFLPKYIESQFHMTATNANLVSGLAILVMGFGIFASGIFMRVYKPNPRLVAGWIAITALAYSIGMIILMFVGCPLHDLAALPGTTVDVGTPVTCNYTCDCTTKGFAPICSEGTTYYSACHAGCHVHSAFNKTDSSLGEQTELFSDCYCTGRNATAVPGYCPLDCGNFWWYVSIFSVFVLIHSTSEVGSMLLTLRCVDPKDKAMALGLISFAIGLFGNVPCPIIYGAVVDSACLIWKERCGERGACSLYDPASFRMLFHGTTGAIMFVAFCVDVIVWYKATNIQFSDEEPVQIAEESIPMNPMNAMCKQDETKV